MVMEHWESRSSVNARHVFDHEASGYHGRVMDTPAVYHGLLEFHHLDIQRHWSDIKLCGGVLVWRVVWVCE